MPGHVGRNSQVIMIAWATAIAVAYNDVQNARAQSTAANKPASEVTTPDVEVTVQGERAGDAPEYRHQSVDAGPLGERKVLDLPFATYGVSSKLIDAQMMHETHELMPFVPSLQMEARFGMEFGPSIIRGFEVDDNSQSTRIDGMNVRADTALPVDLYERYEVLTGPAGSLYGPTYAGGMINATLKRPTDTPLTRVSLQFQGHANATVGVDVGGRFGKRDMYGYRVNVLHADGGTYATDSTLQRNLGSVAFDVRLPTKTTVEVLASDYSYHQLGYPGGFTFGGNSGSTTLPDAPDPRTAALGAPWAGVLAQTRLFEAGVTQRIGDKAKISAGVLHQIADREFHNMLTHTFSDNAGDYTTTYRQAGSQGNVTSNKLYLQSAFKTGRVSHSLSFGTNGFWALAYSKPQLAAGTLTAGTGNLAAPTAFDEPNWRGPGAAYKTSRTYTQSVILNDTVALSPMFSVLAGASLGWINTENYNATGARTAEISADHQVSGTAAIMFKPKPDSTVYANYSDAIQAGESAPACSGNANRDLTNCGQTLDPERSHQFEVGYKWEISKRVDVSLAAFRIKRPFAFGDAATRTFAVIGSQVNRGLELYARGDITRDVTLMSALSLIDAKLDQTQSAATTGANVIGIPVAQGSLAVEYRLPWIRGLAVLGDVHGRSNFPGTPSNSVWVKGYAITDATLRYALPLNGGLLTAQLGVDNITDEHYWASVRGSLSGDPAGTSSAFLGSPRTYKCGLRIDL